MPLSHEKLSKSRDSVELVYWYGELRLDQTHRIIDRRRLRFEPAMDLSWGILMGRSMLSLQSSEGVCAGGLMGGDCILPLCSELQDFSWLVETYPLLRLRWQQPSNEATNADSVILIAQKVLDHALFPARIEGYGT